MAFVALDPEDQFLIIVEILTLVGLLISSFLALRIRSRYPNLTSKGWLEVCIGLFSMALHAGFDVLDTLKWSIEEIDMSDLLNVFDGSFFLLGICLVGLGIWKTASYGAKEWDL